MSETTGWKCHAEGYYWKIIGGHTYCIFKGKKYDGKKYDGTPNGYWFVRRGHRHGSGYVGEWKLLANAKRAAHKHARKVHP